MIRSVLFFGSRCSFADHVLGALIQNGFEIRARFVPGHNGRAKPFQEVSGPAAPRTSELLPMVGSGNTQRSAAPGADPFPTIMIHQHRSPELAQHLDSLDADISIVCCYPRRLPRRLVDAARYGGLNVHPSLLPKYRGPEPLFWIYRNNDRETGVTIHQVDAGLDTGPIVRQQRMDIPLGTPGDELWMELAVNSAALMIDALNDSDSLNVPEIQRDEEASYYSWPESADLLVVPEQWDAREVFHFCRGVIPLGYTPVLAYDGDQREIRQVFAFEDSYTIAGSAVRSRREWITCKSGMVQLKLGTIVG